ncbi:hypothetical protein GGP41_004825 [Bipolaris sorokiniana]|uniref:Required for respiratory growth protein 9, mitochondrial n=2 Tax=Cochliobolus sativus TaxID=45130 RepID=A0A8H6DT01_COCSA|nr:uncharacterized protein COCSADRAFT_31927 [Bipolaris sorokiniana ND90Pr]EMD69166.1 hypothetical protein COCSADRAFT_31927 [Bipolaris sorokiniana ND90Pr]KAF5846738.1 hypothetical protein GGP41_004825 [Bipolaris sorokiniana]
MSCHNCTRRTLSLFIQSFTDLKPVFPTSRPLICPQPSRFRSDLRRLEQIDRPFLRKTKAQPDVDAEAKDALTGELQTKNERPAWQVQKEAMKEKLGGEAWNPRKKLSPDTMEGIRHLNSTQPDKFTTPVLANHFKVSPEAIRRILKSKWRPSDEEYEERMERWNKRGERIWSNLVEMGVKPPKRWRDMGVGRAQNGELPRWKSRYRNQVHVQDSYGGNRENYEPDEDILPTVGKSDKSNPTTSSVPLSQRL